MSLKEWKNKELNRLLLKKFGLISEQQTNEEQIDEGVRDIVAAALMGLFGTTAMAGPLKVGAGGEYASVLADSDTIEVMSDYLDVRTADPKVSGLEGVANMAHRIDMQDKGLNLDDLSKENPQDAYLLRQIAQGFQSQKEKIGIDGIKKKIEAYQKKLSEPEEPAPEVGAMEYQGGNKELHQRMLDLQKTRKF